MSDHIELARRAVACKGWRWVAGMLATEPPVPREVVWDGGSYTPHPEEVGHVYQSRVGEDGSPENTPTVYYSLDEPEVVPDLRDPATLGCLLALVREVHDDPWIRVEPGSAGWHCIHSKPPRGGGMPGNGDSEAEALVAALEAAP